MHQMKIRKKESVEMSVFSLPKNLALVAAVVLTAALAFIVSGCGDDSLSGSGDYFIGTFTSTPTSSLDEGATAVVQAVVTDANGNVASGKEVTFTVSPSSLGYFTPAVATSDASGLVGSIFTATSPGTATLTATVTGNMMNKTMIINETASASGRVAITLTPSLVTANGEDSIVVHVEAEDAAGNPMADGTVIFLVAGERFVDKDHDGYYTEGVDSLMFDANANSRWDPIGVIPSTATIASGEATVVYKVGNQATTVYIRATMIDGSQVEYSEVSAKLNPNTTVASITLSHSGEDIRVKGVGGIEFTQVVATAYDIFGNAVPEGIPLDFVIADGPDGGENLESEGYGPVHKTTNTLGQAFVTLYSGTASGTIRMRATSGSVLSAVTQVVVNAGPPANMSIGVQMCNIRAWDMINVSNGVSANVRDIWGNPVPDSTVIWFTTEEGFVIAHGLTGIGFPKGITEVEWFSGNPRNNGIVMITAETAGGTVRDSVAFISSGPAWNVQIPTYPSSLIADGESKSKVRVYVTDINDNYVVNGTPVAFDTDYGILNGGGTADGCYGSIFETEYHSEVLKRDYSWSQPDDGIGAIAVVQVRAGGVVGPDAYFETMFLTGNTYTGNCEIIIAPEIEPMTTEPFSVVVKDRAGNPLGGHVLYLTTSVGTLSASTLVTDSYGEVNLFFTAPGIQGATVVTVTDDDPRGQVSFAKKVKIKYAE